MTTAEEDLACDLVIGPGSTDPCRYPVWDPIYLVQWRLSGSCARDSVCIFRLVPSAAVVGMVAFSLFRIQRLISYSIFWDFFVIIASRA